MRVKNLARKYLPENKLKLSTSLTKKLELKKQKMESSQQKHNLDDMFTSSDDEDEKQITPVNIDNETPTTLEKRFYSQEDLNLILQGTLTKHPPGNNTLSRRDRLMKIIERSSSDDRDELCPERSQETFWEHPSTRRVGMVFIRPHFDQLRHIWFIHWMKLNYKGEDGRDASYFKISCFEIEELIKHLKTLLSEISVVTPGEPIPRLKNSPFQDEEDREQVERFWAKEHSLFVKSEKIFVRAYLSPEKIYEIKMWRPKPMKHGWHGPQMSWMLGHCRQFVKILEEFQTDIANANIPYTTRN